MKIKYLLLIIASLFSISIQAQEETKINPQENKAIEKIEPKKINKFQDIKRGPLADFEELVFNYAFQKKLEKNTAQKEANDKPGEALIKKNQAVLTLKTTL
jgi:hypothetical protein